MKITSTRVELLIVLTLLAGLASFMSADNSCWGSQDGALIPSITLDARNEPLGTVLEKISKTTRWKIKAPDKWMEKPVSQTLNKAALEDGLKSVLRNAGIEDILLMYDENTRVITLFDTEGPQKQAAERPPAPLRAQPALSSTGHPDPILQRAAERREGNAPSRGSRRSRRQSRSDDD
jgi:hypothetical protein